MDLQKIIEEKTAEIIASGKIENIISEKIEKTIEDLFSEMLKSYSDFGKNLRENIFKSLQVDLSKISFPEYQGVMFSFIKEELDRIMIGEAKEKIQKQISEYFKPLNKDTFKLSELIESFKESISDYHEECTIIIDSGNSDGFFDIYLDEAESTDKYSCDYKIRAKNEGIWSLEINDSDMSKYKGHAIFGFDRLLYQIYTIGKKIEIDQTEFDNYTREEY